MATVREVLGAFAPGRCGIWLVGRISGRDPATLTLEANCLKRLAVLEVALTRVFRDVRPQCRQHRNSVRDSAPIVGP